MRRFVVGITFLCFAGMSVSMEANIDARHIDEELVRRGINGKIGIGYQELYSSLVSNNIIISKVLDDCGDEKATDKKIVDVLDKMLQPYSQDLVRRFIEGTKNKQNVEEGKNRQVAGETKNKQKLTPNTIELVKELVRNSARKVINERRIRKKQKIAKVKEIMGESADALNRLHTGSATLEEIESSMRNIQQSIDDLGNPDISPHGRNRTTQKAAQKLYDSMNGIKDSLSRAQKLQRAQQFQARVFQILKDLVTNVEFVTDPHGAIKESDFQRIMKAVSDITFTEDPIQFMEDGSQKVNISDETRNYEMPKIFETEYLKILWEFFHKYDMGEHNSAQGIKETVVTIIDIFEKYREGEDLPEKSDIKIRVCSDALRNQSFSTRLILLIIRALSGFDYRNTNNVESRSNTIMSTAQGNGVKTHEDKGVFAWKTILQDNWKGSKYCLDECMNVLTVGKITENIDDIIRKIDGACRYLPYDKLDKETKEKVGGTLLKALETAIAYKKGERIPDDLDSNSSVKSLKDLENSMKELGVPPMTVEELVGTTPQIKKKEKVMSELGKVVSELES